MRAVYELTLDLQKDCSGLRNLKESRRHGALGPYTLRHGPKIDRNAKSNFNAAGHSVLVAVPVAFTRHSMIAGSSDPLVFFSVLSFFSFYYGTVDSARSFRRVYIYIPHRYKTHTHTRICIYIKHIHDTRIYDRHLCTNVYIKKYT